MYVIWYIKYVYIYRGPPDRGVGTGTPDTPRNGLTRRTKPYLKTRGDIL